MKKVTEILESWWINIAATGLLGLILLAYGFKLYAGIALGWAACKALDYLKPAKEEKPVAKKKTTRKPAAKKTTTRKPAAKKTTTRKTAAKK